MAAIRAVSWFLRNSSDPESNFSKTSSLRTSLPIARAILLPLLPRLARDYRELELDVVVTDRVIDLVEERTDIAIRWGQLPSSDLVARKLGDSESGGGLSLPVWTDFMAQALKGVPVDEPVAPDGLVRLNGEWFFEENTPSSALMSLGLDAAQPNAPNDGERKSILDLFKP